MITYKNKKVLVFGGNGFLGKHVCEELRDNSYDVYAPTSKEINLLTATCNDHYKYYLRDHNLIKAPNISRLDYGINLAALQGGILFQRSNQANIYHDNLIMGITAFNLFKWLGVKKVVNVATSCSYDCSKEVLVEGDFYNGRPHESVEFFGLAKRGVETYARAMNKNFGTSFVTLGITNLYGPGDSTDLNKTKVTMALVKKFVDAHINKDPSVIVYGDGSPLRDLLYVDDAAFFIRKAMEKYEDKESVLNIGSGKEISIKDLAEKVKGLVGYEGEIEWIKSAPNGQMRKFIDCSKLSKEIGFNPNYLVPIEAGLQKTINYYKESCFTGVS